MTTETKHAPATPLPWAKSKWVTGINDSYVYCNIGNESRACSVSVHGRRFKDGKVTSVRQENGDYKNTLPERDADADAAYIAHAANAYPRLVAHLIAACRSMERSGNESSALEAQSSRALLRELGELA